MDAHSQISKHTTWAAIFAGVLIAVFGLVSIAFKIAKNPIDPSVQFSIFIILLSVVFFYLIKSVEKISSSLDAISISANTPPTTVFRDSEEFFSALLSASISSNAIYTHMLSDPPKSIGKSAGEYFDAVHKKLTRKRDTFNIFRRIATVHSAEKAVWIIDTLAALNAVSSFSLAIQYVEDGCPQTSFHVAANPVKEVLFVWVTMASGGFGQGFSINDDEVAKVMKEEHDREFIRSISLKTGDDFHWANIEELATRFGLLEHPNYIALKSTKT